MDSYGAIVTIVKNSFVFCHGQLGKRGRMVTGMGEMRLREGFCSQMDMCV